MTGNLVRHIAQRALDFVTCADCGTVVGTVPRG
jgi:hypothetical protein